MQELRWIEQFYGTRTARRSGVPLINHIHEGLRIMRHRGNSSEEATRAWCLHPMFQSDTDLSGIFGLIPYVDPVVMALVMEYRNVANRGLRSAMPGIATDFFALSPLYDVNQMLIADKVQNRKDFLKYFPKTDNEYGSLDYYFSMWMRTFTISEVYYNNLCVVAEDVTQPLE